MRVLLSAYACEPGKGSEPEVGWRWAWHLAKKGHHVWVITRENNREAIESELVRHPPITNLHVTYYDLPVWARGWKKGFQGIHLYYLLWQIGSFLKAIRLHRRHGFDRVHHVTFVSVRQPSFMGFLGIPFIFGPVGGGERIPDTFRHDASFQNRTWEWFRDVINGFVRFDPLMHLTFMTAQQIYVSSEATRTLIPRCYHSKTAIQLQVGIDLGAMDFRAKKKTAPLERKSYRIVYAGKLLFLKGLHLVFPAFSRLSNAVPDAHFTIIGSGPDASWLKSLADKEGITDKVTWIPSMPREELLKTLVDYDVFLFPSLRDSGGFVVLEAMAMGLPVVCLNIGGPGVIVNETCGRVIDAQYQPKEVVIEQIHETLFELWKNPLLQHELRVGAQKRVQQFEWEHLVDRLYTSWGSPK